ncbi:diacylglycerol kinase [Fulvimarina endophytica]|uniref:Diacylglycerol kinase n=1 Tax=Fulvimarina endophytica TaxID=2293836 RepID=A0A371X5H1_9HYPH|nr:diacylglycerol kinase [Fulvimarina endophytica]RFC64479.1 diacylglycerol kinase [Fulvimarina endophytica]
MSARPKPFAAEPADAKVPPKRKGLAHLFASTSYSISGLKRLSVEPAFRQEIAATILVLGFHALVGSSAVVWLAQGVLLLVLYALEALNTAIEEIVDHVSPRYSDAARNAKDLGSLAVLFALCANGACLPLAFLL